MEKILSGFITIRSVQLCFVLLGLLAVGCNESEFENVSIPSDEGAVELYLSSVEWFHDSITDVSVIIDEITLSGDNVESYTFSSETLAPINLLDSGIYLGKHILDTGLYNTICIGVRIKSLPEKYKKLDLEFSEGYSFIKSKNDSLIQLYSRENTFCREDTIEIIGGRETTVLLNFNPNKSFKIDTVYNKGIVCHLPPGNPSNRKSLKIGISAVEAHLRHGDFEGPCSPNDKVQFTKKDYDLAYVFEPDFNLSIPLGTVEGSYPGARRYEEVMMLVYPRGIFNDLELSTGFKKSIYEFELDRSFRFLVNLPSGSYDFYAIGKDRRDRFEKVGWKRDVVIEPLKLSTIIVEDIR